MSGVFFVLSVLAYLAPVILVVGGLIALYWVIRRGVAAGIRDARVVASESSTRTTA